MVVGLGDTLLSAKSLISNWKAAVRDIGPQQGLWQNAKIAADQSFPKVPTTGPTAGWKSSLIFLGGLVAVGGAAYDIYNATKEFSNLTPEGKVRSVLVCIRSCAQTLAMIPGIIRAGWPNMKVIGNWAGQRMGLMAQAGAAVEQQAMAEGLELEAFGPQGQPAVQNLQNNANIVAVQKTDWTWWARKGFHALMILISVALVILTTWELIKNWSNYESGQWILVAQVVVQCLQIVAELMILFEVAGVIGTISAFAGPFLAIAGLVLLILAAIFIKVKREPTIYEKWIPSTGKAFTNSTPPPIAAKLLWSLSPQKLSSGQSGEILLVGRNTSNAEVELFKVSTHFFTGQTSNSLFKSSASELWTVAKEPEKIQARQVAVSPVGSASANLVPDGPPQGTEQDETFQRGWQLTVLGPLKDGKPQLALTISAGGSITIALKGTLGKKGSDGKDTEYHFLVEETFLGALGTVGDIVQEDVTFFKG